jgi:ATP-dependent DNA helicase 2 subunit 2
MYFSVHSAIDALIVGIETQDVFLGAKKTWTRKIIILTDGESPMEVEDWEATVKKMTALNIILTVVCVCHHSFYSTLNACRDSGVDFDDDEVPFHEESKSSIKVLSFLLRPSSINSLLADCKRNLLP